MQAPSPASSSDRLSRRLPLAVLFVLAGIWAGGFIARTSFLVDEQRYFVLFDDAMVSMAYARNVAEGHGLVWSTNGRPVEGFTNPLWTASMVLVNMAPLPLRHRSLLVQLGGLVLIGALVVRIRGLLREHFAVDREGMFGWLPAAVLVSFQLTFVYWTLMGMETGLQAVLAVLAIHYAYDIVFAQKYRYLALFTVCAAAYLLRMDMALFVIVTLAWVAAHGGFRWRARHHWLRGAAIFVGIVVAYQFFRLLYFGEWLPNTYYLKLGGVPLMLRLTRGAVKLFFSLRENLILALLFAVAVLGSPGRRSRVLLPAFLLVTYMGYSVWVGGDAWELPDINMPFNRFIAFLLPLAFIVINDLLIRLARSTGTVRRRSTAVAGTALLLLLSNGLVLSPRAGENWRRILLLDRPLFVESHALVLSNVKQLQALVAPGAEVVTYWAGIPAFFSRYRLIDAQGYADSHIAHRALQPEIHWTAYTPGHMKRDPLYLIARRPDAFFQFWDLDDLPVRWPRHHMRGLGYVQVGEFWLRRDSPYLTPAALPPAAPRSR